MDLIAKLPQLAAMIYRRARAAVRARGARQAGMVRASYCRCDCASNPARGCRLTYHNGDLIEPHPSLDWAANLAHMMGALTAKRAGAVPRHACQLCDAAL
jgi:citrate synthase